MNWLPSARSMVGKEYLALMTQHVELNTSQKESGVAVTESRAESNWYPSMRCS